ncbi:MAG: iron ABC transporter permease [Austwickia sp.]|jgi:iron(III) transport system permease protein|nr:MAG: iron ABC transporter permease [Austwickia sp.]
MRQARRQSPPRRGAAAPRPLLLAGVLVAGVALLPVGYLVLRTASAGPASIAQILARPATAALVGRSLVLALGVSILSVLLGVALAYLVVRTDLPGRRVLGVLAPLPLAIPSYVAAFAWVSTAPGFTGLPAATVVLSLCCYPYVYLPVAAALTRLDPAAEEVARCLGRSRWGAFRQVTARQLAPSVAGGALLVALYALSDFGAVSLLRFDAFTRVIHTSYQASFDRTPAAVLGLLLVGLTVLITLGEARFRTRGVARLGAGLARAAEPLPLRRSRVPALTAALALLSAALVFPLGSLGYWAATGLSAGVDWPRLVAAGGNTVVLAGWGALVATLAALPVGLLAARHRSRWSDLLEQATWAGHALPGLVVGLALVFFGVRVVPWAYQREPLLVLAYLVLFLPAAVSAVRAAVELAPVRAEEVARTLGCGPFAAFRRTTLPVAAPGIGAGAALVLLTAMKELPATLLLRPTGTDTLATALWTETGVAAYAAAAPYGLTLVLLAVLPTAALMWGQRR